MTHHEAGSSTNDMLGLDPNLSRCSLVIMSHEAGSSRRYHLCPSTVQYAGALVEGGAGANKVPLGEGRDRVVCLGGCHQKRG